MSDINFSIIPKFIDNMLSPVAQEAGEALADIIKIARIPITTYLKKHEIKLNAALSQLKSDLEKIPDENIVNPKAFIIGPALEDLFKYYLEEDYIVKAFSKLIAASMDKEQTNLVHPKLFWDIKQMSSMDSKVFNIMFLESYPNLYTIQPYAVFYMTGMPFPGYTNYYVPLFPQNDWFSSNIELQIKAYDSIINLSSLGLIRQSVDEKFNTSTDKFKTSNLYPRLEQLRKTAQDDSISTLSFKKDITIHNWVLTNHGLNLANILGLSDYKINLYYKKN